MKIRLRYRQVHGALTERARRLFVASEAMAFGYGGITAASRAKGMAASVIGRGIVEVRAIEGGAVPALPPSGTSAGRRSEEDDGERSDAPRRFAGAGRVDDAWLFGVAAVVDRSEPAPLAWPRSRRRGHETSMKMVARLLKELGYSLQANRKRLEGRAASRSQRTVRAHR